MKLLPKNKNTNSDKELTPKQSILVNRLKKIKNEIDSGAFKGKSANEFLNELNTFNTKKQSS